MKKILVILLLVLSLKSFSQRGVDLKCDHIWIQIAQRGEMKDTVITEEPMSTLTTSLSGTIFIESSYFYLRKYVCVRCLSIKAQTVITKLSTPPKSVH